MRVTRKIFINNDFGLFIVAFGLLIGLVFLFFVTLSGTPKDHTLASTFFVACTSAGLLAGLVNL